MTFDLLFLEKELLQYITENPDQLDEVMALTNKVRKRIYSERRTL